MVRSFLLTLLSVVLAAAVPVAFQGRRIVDAVKVGDARSEREHDYAGEGVTEGAIGGRPFRQASGWLRYSLAAYDDTPVTIVCLFHGSGGHRQPFDLLVDGQKVLTHTFVSPTTVPARVLLSVPIDITRGKTVISVTIRAIDGLSPALIEIQNVQEHLE